MNHLPLAAVWLLLPLLSADAIACSCDKVEASEALKRSTVVVVARVVSTQQAPLNEGGDGKYIVEKAAFQVVESIKGSKKVGDRIEVSSEIGPGSCGRSARNSPVWVEDATHQSSGRAKAVPVSDLWLLFKEGETEPFELSLCSRSSPMNVHGEEDLEVVRRLTRRARDKHEL